MAHGELVVLLGVSGQGRYLLDRDVLEISRGSMIWALAGQRHMLLSESAGFDMWVFLAAPRLWPGRPTVPLVETGDSLGGVRDVAGDVEALDMLARRVQATSGDAERGDGLRWLLAQARVAWEAADPVRGVARVHPAVERAVAVMEARPELPLEEVAALSGLSHSRLRRVFRLDMGEGLSQYRRRLRLQHADRAMEAGATFLDAALAAGYGSYSQFFRDFRAARQLSPRHWYERQTGPGA